MTDNGKKFDGDHPCLFSLMVDQKHFSIPYHPQSNGQVEAVYIVIKRMLKTRLDELKKMCADELSDVMWSYRTTHYTSTTRHLLNWATEPWL